MGWQRSTLRLKFDPSTDFAGLEVDMRRLTVDETVDIALLLDNRPKRRPTGDEDDTSVKALQAWLRIVQEQVTAGLIGWNYADHRDVPVPATAEGVKTCDIEMLMAILRAWVDVAVTVEDPKESNSNGGQQWAAPPGIPMEVHSPSLPN